MKKIIIRHIVVLLIAAGLVSIFLFTDTIANSVARLFLPFIGGILFLTVWSISLVSSLLRNRLQANPSTPQVNTDQLPQSTENIDKHRRALISTAVAWLAFLPGMIIFSGLAFGIIQMIIGGYNLFTLRSYSKMGKISRSLAILSIIASILLFYNGWMEIINAGSKIN